MGYPLAHSRYAISELPRIRVRSVPAGGGASKCAAARVRVGLSHRDFDLELRHDPVDISEPCLACHSRIIVVDICHWIRDDEVGRSNAWSHELIYQGVLNHQIGHWRDDHARQRSRSKVHRAVALSGQDEASER